MGSDQDQRGGNEFIFGFGFMLECETARGRRNSE